MLFPYSVALSASFKYKETERNRFRTVKNYIKSIQIIYVNIKLLFYCITIVSFSKNETSQTRQRDSRNKWWIKKILTLD